MKKANGAIVGCGNISSIYLENLTGRFQNVEVYAVSDLVAEKAKAQAPKGIGLAGTICCGVALLILVVYALAFASAASDAAAELSAMGY